MTNKVELNELTQVVHKEQAFLRALNENFVRLQQAINDTLSRSGVVPNQMEEVLDMNGKRVINVGAAIEDTDALTKQFIDGLIAQVEAAIARLNTLVDQAKQAVQLYYEENIFPPMNAAKIAAQDAARDAKGYYDDTKALYDELSGLAANLSALLAIYADLANIDAVAADLTNIDALAAITTDITAIYNNLATILASPTYAANAQTWAEGTDTAVEALGGTHSAKKWAELSQADVAAEALTRQSVDNNLQSQIDAITAGANVKDIVGTYTDLQNYDTTSLNNNDVVKVITDSTHNDASSYYRWVISGGVGSWSYIGSEGPYLTPAEASTTYVPKTTTINSKALSGNITLDPSDIGAATSAQGAKADTALQNTATGTNSLTILGTPTAGNNSINIGAGSEAPSMGIAIGSSAKAASVKTIAIGEGTTANAVGGIVIGRSGQATAKGAIAIGTGARNSEAGTLKVSLNGDAGASNPAVDEASGLYTLLDSSAKVPSGRLYIASSVDSSSTNSEVVGAKLFYDTCGDIETLILAL